MSGKCHNFFIFQRTRRLKEMLAKRLRLNEEEETTQGERIPPLPTDIWLVIYSILCCDNNLPVLAALVLTSRSFSLALPSPGQILNKDGHLEPWIIRCLSRINNALSNSGRDPLGDFDIRRSDMGLTNPNWPWFAIESKTIPNSHFSVCKLSGAIFFDDVKKDAKAVDPPIIANIMDDEPEWYFIHKFGTRHTLRDILKFPWNEKANKEEWQKTFLHARDCWQVLFYKQDKTPEERAQTKKLDIRRTIALTLWFPRHMVCARPPFVTPPIKLTE
jgi:hypothetical protein